jgi:hypothetical protein
MGKRLTALVIAIAMIGASIALRAALFDDDGNGGRGNANEGGNRDARRLACVTELRDVCDEIANSSGGAITLTVEPAGTTASKLATATSPAKAPYDGWLTFAPWPTIVATRRQQAALDPLFAPSTAPIARSPLVIAVRRERHAVLADACGGAIDWPCVGDQAGKAWDDLPGGDPTWGTVEPAHAHPAREATGALVLAQAVGSYLASAEIPITQVSRGDWENGEKADDFPGWFQRLETSVPAEAFAPGTDIVRRWLQFNLANFSLVGDTEAHLVSTGVLKRNIDVIYPATVSTADVVFAPVRGTSDDLANAARDDTRPFAEAGWRVEQWAAPAGAPRTSPPLPRDNRLPPGGTVAALQDYWSKVVR